MNLKRGDVVIISFPAGMGNPPKRRPAVVVQSDHNNARLSNAVFAMITSNVRLASVEPTQVFLDISTPDGRQTGIRLPSAVKCENLNTSPLTATHKIGRLPAPLLAQVDNALRVALGL